MVATVSTVLVVDDEPDLRFVIRRFLERAGHRVNVAGDGAAALRSCEQARPDLVITDLMMPVMGGIEFIERLRAEPATAAIPVLVLTSDWQVPADADAVLSKPFQPVELIAVAERLMNEGRGLRLSGCQPDYPTWT